MSHCKVFNPVKEILILTERIKQLENQVAEMKRIAQYNHTTNNTTWAVGNWPVGYDGQPLKYTLEGE
jgi:hypothetical protein